MCILVYAYALLGKVKEVIFSLKLLSKKMKWKRKAYFVKVYMFLIGHLRYMVFNIFFS